MADQNQVYTKTKDCVTRAMAGETIIVPVRGRVGDLDSLFTLNETASTIWESIDGQRTAGRIAEALCEKFEVSLEEAVKDVTEFLDRLIEADLIHPAE